MMKPIRVGSVAAVAAIVGLALTAGAALADSADAPASGKEVAINFSSTKIGAGLQIHNTTELIAFIASDSPKRIVIDTNTNSVTAVDG